MNEPPPEVLPGPSVTIPRIQTARLLLREPQRTDFEALSVDAADPIAMAHLGGPTTRREVWRNFLLGAGSWLVSGAGWWTVEHPTRGPVGTVGVFRRELRPDLEMGWVIVRAHWGQGFATEAASAALHFARQSWPQERVIAHVDQGNQASIGVAEKLGFRLEGPADFYGAPTLRFVVGAEVDA